ncbi:ankyrin repeat domain-containing protein [Eoetvoesiella caeni]|nr:ankyrin repeat domain-containing protein [Eoetvoesiella caeni]MCI2807615.1 ankyrin repeat domain-containing protein [Eoetvoesiella caeni]
MKERLRVCMAVNHNTARCVFGGLLLCFATAVAAVSPSWWVDIANDRVEAIKTELAQGESPNEISPKGQPALMQAIRDGAWKVYDLLAAHRRVDVNAENRMHETPLMYLAVVGDVKRAQALIKRGAKVNHLGWSPLHYAASKGHADMVKLLVVNKAIVNAPSPEGTTPLMMAAFAGSDESVRILLSAGADVTTRNLKQQNAADWARMRNQAGLAKRLDQLNAKVLAERAAAHARNRAAGAAEEENGSAAVGGLGAAAVAGGAAAAGVSTPAATQAPGAYGLQMPEGLTPDAGYRSGNSRAPAASSGNEVKAVDISPPAIPPSFDTGKPAKPSATEGNATSRYFDLNRFDKDPAY